MAGAKETPRQKLISLMYLVFITMLALNVSKEVLDGFGQMFVKLKSANQRVDSGNQIYYQKISTNAKEKEGKWIGHDRTASEIKKVSNEFYDKISQIKNRITEKQKEKDPDLKEYSQMDKGEALDLIFFDANGVSEEGNAFVDMIYQYKGTVIQVFGSQYPQYIDLVEERFFTGDQNNNIKTKDGTDQSWLQANFEGFPLISSLAKLTMMQNDIRLTESDVLATLLGQELERESGVTESNYITLLKTEKGAYYQGEIFDGSVILGRKGGAQNPNSVNLELDGITLNETQYELIPGGVKLNVQTGNPGDHELKGNLVFLNDGVESKIPVDQTFPVISKPNSAVISADKMNVVYRGVENPMTISIPGIPDSKVNASAPGLRKARGSKFVMVPGRGSEVNITASGVLPDGQRIATNSKFRIKDIPAPQGTVRRETGNVTIPKASLEIASIGAVLEDFDFDITLETVSFNFKAPGQATILVRGNKLDAKAKDALKRVRAGSTVQIFDIKVRNPKNPNYKFKKISPVICEIVN
jgi:gliding motility-associated protein GldM